VDFSDGLFSILAGQGHMPHRHPPLPPPPKRKRRTPK
jgi:hypothetical protein